MYTGLTGKVTIKENTTEQIIAYISNWSVEDKVELIEVAKLGKRVKDKIAGLHSWTASADGAIDFANSSNQTALFAALHNGTKLDFKFYLDTSVVFAGVGLIESLSIDLSAEDKGNVSISISGVDELQYPGQPEPTGQTEPTE
jgi:predicted secreted protein